MNKSKKIITALLVILLLGTFPNKTNAQNAISFAISPPITEITIAPGKEYRQTYVLQNNGGDINLKPKIVYFNPSDNLGNIELTENEAPEWIKYDKSDFRLKFEEQKTFNVIINPPEGTEELDHYLTLVFESQQASDLLGQTSSFYKTEIGSNILITISKDGNPKLSAEVANFSAPKFIDSIFGKIEYEVKLENNGNGYWKPNGKINITNNRNQSSLKLAPLNILSGKEREISCIEGEELKSCEVKSNFLVGKVISTIEFTTDEDPKIYKETVTTIALPISLIFLVIFLLTIYRIKWIFNLWIRKK